MLLSFLLGLFLNSVIGFACIFPVGFLFMALISYAASLPVGGSGGIIYLVAIVLVVLVPFFGLNIIFSLFLRRKMKSLYYEKIQMVSLQITYWIGAVVFFCLPAILLLTFFASGVG